MQFWRHLITISSSPMIGQLIGGSRSKFAWTCTDWPLLVIQVSCLINSIRQWSWLMHLQGWIQGEVQCSSRHKQAKVLGEKESKVWAVTCLSRLDPPASVRSLRQSLLFTWLSSVRELCRQASWKWLVNLSSSVYSVTIAIVRTRTWTAAAIQVDCHIAPAFCLYVVSFNSTTSSTLVSLAVPNVWVFCSAWSFILFGQGVTIDHDWQRQCTGHLLIES